MEQQFVLEPADPRTMAEVEQLRRSNVLRPAAPEYIRFYSRSKLNELKTYGGQHEDESGAIVKVKPAGRPIYEPVEYIEIFTPGDKDTIVDRPVRKLDMYIYPEKYTAFRNGKSQHGGVPLKEWGGVSAERVLELQHFNITTVEQYALVPDGNLPNLGLGARDEREKCRQYLEAMKGNAPVAELKAENELLKARLVALEETAKNSSMAPAAAIEDAESSAAAEHGKKRKARAAI